VVLQTGEVIPCGLVVWSTGLSPQPFVQQLNVLKNKQGQVVHIFCMFQFKYIFIVFRLKSKVLRSFPNFFQKKIFSFGSIDYIDFKSGVSLKKYMCYRYSMPTVTRFFGQFCTRHVTRI